MTLRTVPRTPSDCGASIEARGPLSHSVLAYIRSATSVDRPPTGELARLVRHALHNGEDLSDDDDIQLSLFVLYGLTYRSLHAMSSVSEWDPTLVAVRLELESAFQGELRDSIAAPAGAELGARAVAQALGVLTEQASGHQVARYVARQATARQFREFLKHRSIYQLREADPHSWALPRLTGKPKAALIEIQADEYGGGRAERIHAAMYAATMRAAGLDDTYGAYVNEVGALTLASHNVMSMFGLNASLVGALVGHLAAYEMTSTVPSRLYAQGARRLGFGEEGAEYFDEHVEADAVHEQIAAHDLAGSLAEQQPGLVPDILWGAAVYLALDERCGARMIEAWQRGWSSLRDAGSPGRAA